MFSYLHFTMHRPFIGFNSMTFDSKNSRLPFFSEKKSEPISIHLFEHWRVANPHVLQ